MYIAYHIPSEGATSRTIAALNMIGEILFSPFRTSDPRAGELVFVEGIWGGANARKIRASCNLVRASKGELRSSRFEDSIYTQVDLLRSKLVNQDELDRARNNLRAQLVYELDRPSRVAGTLGFY